MKWGERQQKGFQGKNPHTPNVAFESRSFKLFDVGDTFKLML